MAVAAGTIAVGWGAELGVLGSAVGPGVVVGVGDTPDAVGDGVDDAVAVGTACTAAVSTARALVRNWR
jgi:hypothetical protein